MVFGVAAGTDPSNISVRQRHFASFAVRLSDISSGDCAGFVETVEYQLTEAFVLRRVCRVVVVELDKKVAEVLLMFFVNSFDKLFRAYTLFSRGNHDWSAVCVVGAEVQATVAAQLMEADPDIGLQIFDQMTYMYRAVCIRQS